MNYHPNFERLKTTLFGGKADRVPLMELSVDLKIQGQFIGRPIETVTDRIEFAQKAGYDFVRLAPTIDFNPDKVTPKEGDRSSAESATDTAREWHSEGVGIITSLNDFEKYRWPELHEVSYQLFEEIQSELPDGMKIVGQYGDIFTWVWDFMGFETFSFAMIDNEALIEAMFDKVGSIVYELFRNMADMDNVGALFYSDDIAFGSGLLMSPKVFRTYLFPWMKKIAALCQAQNMPFIYHTDGKIWEVLDDLHELGVNAIQPLEPQAIDIREVKQKYGDKFCLVGNVDVDLLSRGTPAEIEVVSKGLIEDVGKNGGYCLGSGNTVPAYVPIENYRAMVEAGWKYGAY